MIEGLFEKSVLVLGCGNILFGDEGFGPAVIRRLQYAYSFPDDVLLLDAGISIRDIIFDLTLSPQKPKEMIVLDAVKRLDRSPGEVFEIQIDQIPEKKAGDCSPHQLPMVDFLYDLQRYAQIDIKVLAAQVDHMPDQVQPGLSNAMQEAVQTACRRIMSLVMH